MRKIIFGMLLANLCFAGSTVKEFDRSEEVICHGELETLGCLTKDGIEIPRCAEKHLGKLSTPCQNIHKVKSKR